MNEDKESFVKEILKFALIAILIVVPFRIFIAQPFIVSGASMSPTFETGQYLIVDQLSYQFEEPSRGDVIIFKFPQDPSKFFIKRIIGLPGEIVEIKEGTVSVRNRDSTEALILDETYVIPENRRNDSITAVLRDDEYYVMGDNRGASADSRLWGPLKEDLIVGRAIIRVLPITKLDLFPGKI